MRRTLLTLMLALLATATTPLRGQITHASQGRLDENASATLKKAAARFEQNVSFTVKVTLLDSQHQTQATHTAQVRYHKGRYRLTMEGQEVICDGTTVWQWNKAAAEVAVSNLGADDADLLNPGRLLANYEQHFRAKYIRTDDDGTAVIDLQPRSARNYHKIRLLVDERSGLLRRMEVHRFDSGRELYDISQFKRASTPASQFSFDAAQHPEVELIDMR